MNYVKLLQVQGPVIGTVSKNDSDLKQTNKTVWIIINITFHSWNFWAMVLLGKMVKKKIIQSPPLFMITLKKERKTNDNVR